MKKILLSLITLIVINNFLFAQDLISSAYKGTTTAQSLNDQFGVALFDYDVDYYKITYTTPDIHGVLDTASGLVILPNVNDKAFPMLCYQHGTVGSKEDVPSNLQGGYLLSVIWAATGYVTFAPDFLGLGEARGFHPYVHADSEASAAIDMLYATKEFADGNSTHYNEQLFLTGYSQGGHAAAALQKELQENHATTLPVTASAPMSGPYSISGVMQDFMNSLEPYGFVGYLPYTLLSYQEVYGNLYTELTDIYKPAYAPMVEQFYNAEIDLGELNTMLTAQLIADYGASIPLKMIRDDVTAEVQSNPDHPFNVAMRDNDVHNWAPTAPTRLYYCTADDQVPFENSVVADSVMNSLGAVDLAAIDVSSISNHTECVQFALIFGDFFFSGYQRIDDLTNVHNLELTDYYAVYPNPANELLFVENKKENGFLQLIDINGKVLLESNLSEGQNQINIAAIPTGMYFLKMNYEDSFFTEKLMVR